jgi:iron complex outermembrane receptor protein
MEAELSAFLMKGLEAMYSVGYTHAVYETLKLSSNGTAKELSGKKQLFTPDMTSMLALKYSLYLSRSKSLKLFVRSDWKYLGNTFFDLKNSIQQSSYHLLNVSIGIMSKHYECRVWANNLTDTRYISYAYDFGAVHLGNPETYGISFKLSF